MMSEYEVIYFMFKYTWDNKRHLYYNKLLEGEPRRKCNEVALHIKKLGNNSFERKNNEEARKLYIKGLKIAEPNSDISGILLGNLSVIHFYNKKYKECIEHIKIAETTSIPKKVLLKLYIREIKCWKYLSNNKNAQKAFKNFTDCLTNIDLNNEIKETFKLNANLALSTVSAECDVITDDFIIPKIKDQNQLYPLFSNKVEVRYLSKASHIVSRCHIAKGELLFMSEPFSLYCTEEYCISCYKKYTVLVPCDNCLTIGYCSKTCKEHDVPIHQWECKLYQLEICDKLSGIILHALRVYLRYYIINSKSVVYPIPVLYEYIKALKDYYYYSFNKDNPLIIKLIEECGVITAHLNIMNFYQGDQLCYLMGTSIIMLAIILKNNSYNVNTDSGIYISYFYQVYNNFKHSCVPNTELQIINSKLVIKSLHSIVPNSPVYIAYKGVEFYRMSTVDRKVYLSNNYGITCNCIGCTNINFDPDVINSILCPVCNAPTGCQHIYKLLCKCKYHFVTKQTYLNLMEQKQCKFCNSAFSDCNNVATYTCTSCGYTKQDNSPLLDTIFSDSTKSTDNLLKKLQIAKINSSSYAYFICNLKMTIDNIKTGDLSKAVDWIDKLKNAYYYPYCYKYIFLIFQALEVITKDMYKTDQMLSDVDVVKKIIMFLINFKGDTEIFEPKKKIFARIEILMTFYQLNELKYKMIRSAINENW